MYGVGIRAGFYLQRFGRRLASLIAWSEVAGKRLSNSLFVAATFLALSTQTAGDNLGPVEGYIVLLLCLGWCLHFAPLYVWRLLTCCQPRLDPTRYKRVRSGRAYSYLNFGLLLAVAIFQL